MSKKLFEQEQERTLQEIEDNKEDLNTRIDESCQRIQDNINAWHQESLNIINKEMSDYERASRG